MSSTSLLVYPESPYWPLTTGAMDEKPGLVLPPFRRSESSLPDMLRQPKEEPSSPTQRPLTPVVPSRHYRSSSRRSSRKRDDPDYVARPRNAFFVYRCDYTRRHSEEAKGDGRAPTPEKTLSKRAGANWKQMTDAQKQPYRDRAKQESLEHTKNNPGYRYRPQRSKPPKPRSSGAQTRRQRVESLVRVCEGSAVMHPDSSSEYPTIDSPVSYTSSSPEPVGPETPMDAQFQNRGLAHRCERMGPLVRVREGSAVMLPDCSEYSTIDGGVGYTSSYTKPIGTETPRDAQFQHRGLAHRRSMSLPRFDIAHSNNPYTYSHTYILQPASCSSSPGPNTRQRSYSPSVSSIPPPDTAFDLEYGDVTIPFASLQPHASTMSLPELLSLPDLTIHDNGSSIDSTPQMSPAASLYEHPASDYFPMQSAQSVPVPSAPLFQRRQRANTAPSAFISPLTMLSSTLDGYAGSASSSGSTGIPSLNIQPMDTSLSVTPTRASLAVASAPTVGGYAYGLHNPSSSLLVPQADVDFDRTPRRADFATNVQDLYPQPTYTTPATSAPAAFFPPQGGESASSSDSFAMQSYNVGLDTYDIASTAASSYDMAPFDDIDFSDFIHVNPPDGAPTPPMY